ncbi:phosphotransferase [Sessilibacter corallicola]|uniref:phosphotransferase n=1 Tax=Sessilibacter corallicola TaxID=2904075 RepID=UPI001E4B8D0F|nr:phosphotransferase [Sessilibacter corallicola]MCE2028651.1 phosphotransferase [Sessilibacter corallicola]
MNSTEEHSLLNTALATWNDWRLPLDRRPSVISKSELGLTNGTYFLSSRSDKKIEFTLRLFSKKSELFGINRSYERIIQSAVAEINLAPKIYYYDETLGFSVCEYVHGYVTDEKEFKKPNHQNLVIHAIKQYQKIKLELPKFNYYRHLNNYASHLQNRFTAEEQQQWLDFSKNLQVWQENNWQPTLTHHDLNHANVIFTENSLSIIDWEYAGFGHGQFDLISIGSHSKTDSKKDQEFIKQIQQWLNTLWFKF